MTGRLDQWPSWLRDVDAAVAVHSHVALWGSVRDIVLVPDGAGRVRRHPQQALWDVLRQSGFEALVVHHPVDGQWVFGDGDAASASELLGRTLSTSPVPADLPVLLDTIRRVGRGGRRIALLVEDASRLGGNPEEPTEEERLFWVGVDRASRTARPAYLAGAPRRVVYPCVIWALDGEFDLPAWLLRGNESFRAIPMAPPDHGDRTAAAVQLIGEVFPDADLDEASRRQVAETFASLSEGMTLSAMADVSRLAVDLGIGPLEIADAVRAYQVGVVESPWRREFLRQRVADGEREIGRRVRGQQAAVTKTLDLLKRSVVGLTGAQAGGHSTRPRGVLFFAGPTGVGKTELAKAITELVFGDERAYIRFDMSEFSSEHSEARLIGAPPGYVGHDAGGQLTDSVRRRPFSLVLFDEIEKAHPRILDKFLQVLEDGRLTDGRGMTAHFSETILVFTSNLGIYKESPDGTREANVSPDMPYEVVDRKVRQAITDHFTFTINRPELLNRLGDNVVVFGFIDPATGAELVDMFLDNVKRRVEREHDLALEVLPAAHATLLQWATDDLSLGGRGIGSVLESHFVNPLARLLFSEGRPDDGRLVVGGLSRADGVTSIHMAP